MTKASIQFNITHVNTCCRASQRSPCGPQTSCASSKIHFKIKPRSHRTSVGFPCLERCSRVREAWVKDRSSYRTQMPCASQACSCKILLEGLKKCVEEGKKFRVKTLGIVMFLWRSLKISSNSDTADKSQHVRILREDVAVSFGNLVTGSHTGRFR